MSICVFGHCVWWPVYQLVNLNTRNLVFYNLFFRVLWVSFETIGYLKSNLFTRIQEFNIRGQNVIEETFFHFSRHSSRQLSAVNYFVKKLYLRWFSGFQMRLTMHWLSHTKSEETAIGGVLWKKLFLKKLQNSQENTCVKVSFLIKLQDWDLQLS